MRIKTIILGNIIVALIGYNTFAGSTHAYQSKYIGQEHREIKSLSQEDIEELQQGKGWGLAKAAELNGIPGPAHLLEMKTEIQLTSQQVEKIEQLYAEMEANAIQVGLEFIELERQLNTAFAERAIDEESLQELLGHIEKIRAQLRYVHLSTHLKALPILTSEQITSYNKLRGYSSDDPCSNIPPGHDPEMWKKHNNCS